MNRHFFILLNCLSLALALGSTPWEFDNILEPTDDNGRIGGLFLGDYHSAKDFGQLGENQITAVLSLLDDQLLLDELKDLYDRVDIKHLALFAHDIPNYDISVLFPQALKFIDENLETGNVLVHCFAGVSRSATVAAAFLMLKHGMSLNMALDLLKEKRDVVSPNPGFLAILRSFEHQVKEKNDL
jgi:protein-tyrosine phosphatase